MRGFHGAKHGAGEGGGDLLAGQALAEAPGLIAADIGKADVDGSGEAILGAELGGAVADEKYARSHACILPEKKEARDL
jgi:hypothetical protein